MNKYFFLSLFLFCLFSCKSDQSTSTNPSSNKDATGNAQLNQEQMFYDNSKNKKNQQGKQKDADQKNTNQKTIPTVYTSTTNKTATNGVEYSIFSTGEKGQKARLQDYLTVHLKYSTLQDSLIYSSYKQKVPLHFKFSETLFRGVLSEGITQMQPKDSAVFIVPAEMMYPTRLPSFLKNGDKLKYHLKLIDLEDPSSKEK